MTELWFLWLFWLPSAGCSVFTSAMLESRAFSVYVIQISLFISLELYAEGFMYIEQVRAGNQRGVFQAEF